MVTVGKPAMGWAYTLVNCNTEACCWSMGRFYKGTLYTYTQKNCSLNVFLRDLLTIALTIHPFLPCLSFIISLFLSASLSLFISRASQGAYRCLILCIKNSPQFLIVEYFMPFNFSHALKVTLPSLHFMSPFSHHTVKALYNLLSLQQRCDCRNTPYYHYYGINHP